MIITKGAQIHIRLYGRTTSEANIHIIENIYPKILPKPIYLLISPLDFRRVGLTSTSLLFSDIVKAKIIEIKIPMSLSVSSSVFNQE